MHEGAGLRVEASDRRIDVDTVAALHLGPGRLGLRIPVRVLQVIEEDRRRGFAYGTLPGHPVAGEESFVVELAPDGEVHVDLVSFSRPARWFTVLAAPLTRAGQYLVSERYLAAVRAAVAAAASR
jgi:uncharacterized protein (UPF0548 family)